MANLNPADTQFVEFHGTGTKAGDSAEFRAISSTINAAKSQPLYCGSVKSRVGHTEAAAGLAAIIKCVMCLEKGEITPNLNFVTPNPKLKLASSNAIVPTSTIPWPECEVRRCSVNNFGFGGTNAHVILDDAYNFLRLRGKLPEESSESEVTRPRVFVLSASEQTGIARQRQTHEGYVESKAETVSLQALSRTLSERRSLFQWRHAVVASSVDELMSEWRDDTIKPIKAAASPNIAFVFTGQGAQWYAMGRELVVFSEFADSVRQSAAYLASLGCTWDAWAELMQPESDFESKLSQAEYSQPLCSVLQIALVDLSRNWGITPMAVIGHSSGEIAAAYAADALSRENCLKIAYHRGIVSKIAQIESPGGRMMAVGLSAEAIEPYLTRSGAGVVVACFNSPKSLTLAGDGTALDSLKEILDQDKVFCRLLHVENAYHSPQMLSVSAEYGQRIKDISPLQGSSAVFYSTVLGRDIPVSDLTSTYWVQNLCSPVRFVEALDAMMYTDASLGQLKAKSKLPGLLFEIGPHSALAGPIKQYISCRDTLANLTYINMLTREQDASLTAVGAAAKLWTLGIPVRLDKVSRIIMRNYLVVFAFLLM